MSDPNRETGFARKRAPRERSLSSVGRLPRRDRFGGDIWIARIGPVSAAAVGTLHRYRARLAGRGTSPAIQ